MFDHLSSAPFEGRDARMLSSISEAIFVEEAPSDHHSLTDIDSLDDTVLVLLREYAGLKADQEERAYWQHRLDSLTRNHTPEEDDEGIEDAEQMLAATEIEQQPDFERTSYKEPRMLVARPPFARRYRGNDLVVRKRLGDGWLIDLARLPKVGLPDSSDRTSATIIPFPIERAMARKDAIKETASETASAPPLSDHDAGVRVDEEATVIGDASPIEEDLVVAEQIGEDVFSLVDVEESLANEEGSIALPNDGDVEALADEGAAASSSAVYGSTEIISDDEEPIVEAPEADRCHRDWSRAQRRHFVAYASVGHSAMTIAKLMKQACGESVAVKTVRMALADRTGKLKRAEAKESSKGGMCPL